MRCSVRLCCVSGPLTRRGRCRFRCWLDVGVGEDALQLALGDHLAVEEVNLALGMGGKAGIVGNHADGCALTVQVGQQAHDGLAVLTVQVSGWLVGEQDGRGSGEGAGNGDALLLTAGELGGIVAHAMGHVDALKRVLDTVLALACRHAGAIGQRQLDVLVDGEVADQVEALEDEADLLVADAGAVTEVQVGDLFRVEGVAAVSGSVEQADDREQRRLAAAGGAGHGNVLAAGDVEVNARERVGFDLVGVEDLGEVLDLDQVVGCGHIVVSPSRTG